MDARELKEKASQLFTKGKFAKAAEAYEAFCKADPKDMQSRLRMGDAWSKAGNKPKAVQAYQFAAEGFAKEGFLPRAIAASKLVLELEPSHQGVQQMLADLYARKTGSTRPAPPAPRLKTAELEPVKEPSPPSPAVEDPMEDVGVDIELDSPPSTGGFVIEVESASDVKTAETTLDDQTFEEVEAQRSGEAVLLDESVAPTIQADAIPQPAPPWMPPVTPASSSPSETDLERSLRALAIVEEPTTPEMTSPVVPPPVPKARPSAFTELDLDDDNLLHAVEAAAAPMSSPSVLVSADEIETDDTRTGMPRIPLFSDLPADAFIALFDQCPLRRYDHGQQVIAQGSKGDGFYVVCSGSVRVLREANGETSEIATLDEGSFFGEMAVLSGSARTASVVAHGEDTQLLEIAGSVLKQLSRQHPSVSTALKKFYRQRLLSNLMNSAPIFKPFNKNDRRELVQRFKARDVPAGELVIREGQITDGLYVVLAGEVAVSVGGTKVGVVKEGELFGEMSLLTRAPAAATVTSSKRTSLLRLPKDDFDRLIMSHPQILEMVAELTDARRKQNAQTLRLV